MISDESERLAAEVSVPLSSVHMLAVRKEIPNASRNPTSPPSVMAQHSAKMVPTWSQKPRKTSQDGAQGHQYGAKMAPRWGQDGEKIEENANVTTRWVELNSAPPLCPKMMPRWRQLGSQNGAKMAKKSIPKSIIFLMPPGGDLWVDFG